MPDFRSTKRHYIPPDVLGMNAKAVDSEATSSTFDATGFTNLLLCIFYDRSAATGNLDIELDHYDPAQDKWFPVNSAAVAAGISTMTDLTIRRATGSADQTFEVRLEKLDFGKMRIRAVVDGGTPDSSDKVTISATLSFHGA